ncbi:TonB-dependent receptor [Desulfovibrio aminophilus]|nr:TonB-dependent receptor [Desulfovibrio aminophilus]MCM0756932.1 TonB-dependent receptor [Desulfovibrio aminophilus]
MRRGLFLATVAQLAVLLFGGQPARAEHADAQDNQGPYTLEEITVTAEKQEENVQAVPASVTVYTSEQIESFGVDETSRIFEKTPNLHMVKSGPKASLGSFASMRGITSMHGTAPSLGFYVDDVYYSNFDISLFDVERIEVLKGPQGTLYGRNAEAGIINVVTRKPGNEWSAALDAGVGNHAARTTGASFGGPLVDDELSVRFSGRYQATDGYFTNTATGADDADRSEDVDSRLTLDWRPDDAWDFLWNLEVQDYSAKYAEFARLDGIKDHPHDVSLDYDGLADKNAYGSSLRAERDLDGMKLVSITAARTEDTQMNTDGDFTAADIAVQLRKKSIQLFSEEIRLVSDTGDPFQWLVGLYAFHEDEDLSAWMDRHAAPITNFLQRGDTDTNGAAVFGQASYTFWDRLTCTLGLRYDRERKSYDYQWKGGAVFGYADQAGETEKLFQAWLPKLAVDYKFSDDLMAYVSASRGFKSGGFNLKSDPGTAYDAEYTWNYETGVKSEWFDKRLQLNLSVFYIKWDDQQVEVPSYPNFTIVNAGSSSSKGFEAEFRARPLSGLEMFGGFGYTHSVFDEFNDGTTDYAGKRNPNIPGYTAYLGSTYHFQNGFFVNAEYNRIGKNYFDLANQVAQGDYQTVNAKLGYEHDGYEVYLWGRNLFNATYVTRAFQSGTQWFGRAGEPFTFGVNLGCRF